MNPTVTPAALMTSTLWPRIKTWLWHREVRVFLIHFALWMAWDMLQAYLFLNYVTLDPAKAELGFLIKFKDNLGGYFLHSLWSNGIFLLTVHADYWLFRRLFRRESIWRVIVFVGTQVVYLFVLSGYMGFMYGYFDIDIKSPGLLSGVLFMWGYALIFVFMRTFRSNRRERKQAEIQRIETEKQYR